MIQTKAILDDLGGNLIVNRVQDVEPIVNHAAALRQSGEVGSRDMKLAATLPGVVVEQYLATNGITFREFCQDEIHAKRMLNDPALSAFRVWEGRL